MKEMSFENAMQELEEITGKLEKGNLSLDESVASFEEGMKLAKKCNNILEDAEKKIKILVQKDENIEEEDFKIEE
jgi:exodeoxyribonuclease VII, small subunit